MLGLVGTRPHATEEAPALFLLFLRPVWAAAVQIERLPLLASLVEQLDKIRNTLRELP